MSIRLHPQIVNKITWIHNFAQYNPALSDGLFATAAVSGLHHITKLSLRRRTLHQALVSTCLTPRALRPVRGGYAITGRRRKPWRNLQQG